VNKEHEVLVERYLKETSNIVSVRTDGDGSDDGDEWRLQDLTVPSEDAEITAQDMSAISLGTWVDAEAIQTHLILVA